jgi:WD40 repeat protein
MAGPSIADRLRANVDARHGDGIQKRYALLVGIDQYDDPTLRPLSYCVRDVTTLASTLAGRGYQVQTLTDGLAPERSPTLANVRRELEALVSRADEDDILLVHFSCHGDIVDDKPHLLLRDTPAGPDGIRAAGLPLATLLTILRGKPRWIAIFLDACHMGLGLGLDPEAVLSSREVQLRAGGFALLSGSTEGQITQDSDNLGSGIFTAALISGLAGAAAEPNGRVLFSSLAQHVQRQVTAWRTSAEGLSKLASQTPVVRLEVSDLLVLPPLGFVALDGGHTGALSNPELSNKIRAAAFSPDGRWIATAGEDCTVRLWSPATGKAGPGPMYHDGHVGGVAFSSNSLLLATASNDGLVRTWQAPGASFLQSSVPHGLPPRWGRVHAVVWMADGQRLAAASDVGPLVLSSDRLHDPPLALHGHTGPVWCVAASADGHVASGGEDGTARVWDLRPNKPPLTIVAGGPVWAITFSNDGRRVITGGADKPSQSELANVPRVWDAQTGKLLFALKGHTRGVTAIACSPDGARIATSSYDGTTRLWDATDGRPLAALSLPGAPEAYGVAFSPKGDLLFVGYADGRGVMFDVSSNAPVGVQD